MGLGTGRTGHAGRAWEGCGDADRGCIGLVLRAPAKPRGQQSLQGAESRRSCSAGCRRQLCLALAAGTGAEARHGPLGQRSTPQMGQVGITPLVLHPPRGVTPTAGAAGVRGRQRRGAGLAPCMLHSRPWDRRNTDAGKWGTSRDPKRRGALGSCAARRTEIPRMGAPIEEQGPRNTECPRGKRDHGSPRASSAWKWAARGKGTEVG